MGHYGMEKPCTNFTRKPIRHAKKLIKTVEGLYITVTTISFYTFSESVHRQMIHRLKKYVFAGKHAVPFPCENE
jgi:hypothetical protein